MVSGRCWSWEFVEGGGGGGRGGACTVQRGGRELIVIRGRNFKAIALASPQCRDGVCCIFAPINEMLLEPRAIPREVEGGGGVLICCLR